jgi:hypothetical protein
MTTVIRRIIVDDGILQLLLQMLWLLLLQLLWLLLLQLVLLLLRTDKKNAGGGDDGEGGLWYDCYCYCYFYCCYYYYYYYNDDDDDDDDYWYYQQSPFINKNKHGTHDESVNMVSGGPSRCHTRHNTTQHVIFVFHNRF